MSHNCYRCTCCDQTGHSRGEFTSGQYRGCSRTYHCFAVSDGAKRAGWLFEPKEWKMGTKSIGRRGAEGEDRRNHWLGQRYASSSPAVIW